MPEAHAARRDRLRARLAEIDVEAALITSLVNVRYLTGLVSSNAALLVRQDGALLATDGRYAGQAGEQAPDVELHVDRKTAAALAAKAKEAGVQRLAFEDHEVTVELFGRLGEAAERVELVSLQHAVEGLRMVKDNEELDCLREACAITDRALTDVMYQVMPGRSERSIARELETRMVEHGAEAPAFDTIVASGPNSAFPHHRPTDRVLEVGDFLKIDMGALYRGYHADMTRTFVVGADPQGWQAEVHALVFAAQKAGREALATGVDVKDVDEAARSVIVDAGHGDDFPHGLGHGVGLQIHEAPLMGYGATGILDDRTPVTVEPGVYLPGRGGVRIEDTLVVRGDGAELLTTTTKELVVLG